MEGRERGGGDALGLAFEAFGNQSLYTAGIEVKHARDQAKCKNVFALVLGRAADGFHSKLGNRTADVAEFFLQILRGSTCAVSYKTIPPSLTKSMWLS